MKKVLNDKLKLIKLLLFLILFFVFCFEVNYQINNTKKFDSVFYEVDEKEKVEVAKNDKIEEIVGTSEGLSDFYLGLRSNDGNTEVTHPKVISFDKKWNGYKYWAAYTPYPNGDQAKENPHVLVSNDMVNWKLKKGMKNPLDVPKTKDFLHIYNSDTHLVYNDDLDILECYWRFVNDVKDEVIIYKRTTKDGFNWTEKEVFLKSKRSKKDYLSPAIIYENKVYKVWYVDRDKKIKYFEYDPYNEKWSETFIININYNDKKLQSWHLDVIKTNKGYEAIIVAFESWEQRAKMKLYYSFSEDNNKWTSAKEILSSDKKGGLYRSSILFINDTYYIFYAEITDRHKRGVNIVYGTDINKLYSLKEKNVSKFIQYVKKNG